MADRKEEKKMNHRTTEEVQDALIRLHTKIELRDVFYDLLMERNALLSESKQRETTRIIVTGSVVKLRSGGPWMTVTRVDGAQCVCCSWFGQNTSLGSSAAFPMETLVIKANQ